MCTGATLSRLRPGEDVLRNNAGLLLFLLVSPREYVSGGRGLVSGGRGLVSEGRGLVSGGRGIMQACSSSSWYRHASMSGEAEV